MPYMVEVTSPAKCPEVGETFSYAEHSGCPVLAKASEETSLSLNFVSYGVDGSNKTKGSELTYYKFVLPNDKAVQVNEHFLSSFDDEILFDDVALVQATVNQHCVSYAPDCGDKQTQGDTAIIGRTVPASLSVEQIIAGDISGDVVYAGQQESVEFEAIPGFVVKGLDIDGSALPSYSGEFAGGLKASGNSRVELDTTLSYSELALSYSEPEPGQHRIELDPDSLSFIKDQPFAETGLNLPLELTIKGHDQTLGVNGETTLADADDKLRFGYLTLEDLELPLGLEGKMPTHLNYYSTDTGTVAEDTTFTYVLQPSAVLDVPDMPSPPLTLTVADQSIEVSAYDKAWSGKVSMEVPLWLQPHKDGALAHPSARLNITEDPRKRGNDRVFNRREVAR
ncbi:hypothetical protein BFR47_08940 [Oceanisphaera psychrotolerans]|uniref:DUF6701 domain-containing protein n=1 Tax=Oceanisphaera psychrotolerans TaxID=1414654 RepID=A0A1J4QGS0_9GAMM|nr:hypothetical protein BFR47_08940 [Oceanisphaera psychrotolerans]